MSRFQILEIPLFVETFSKLELVEQQRVERFIAQLPEQGDLVGKPLGYPYFREKKFNGKRLYFLVYSDLDAILLVDVSDKKQQAMTIFKIKQALPELRKYVEQKMKETTEDDGVSKY